VFRMADEAMLGAIDDRSILGSEVAEGRQVQGKSKVKLVTAW
jgi:hypothetical protein